MPTQKQLFYLISAGTLLLISIPFCALATHWEWQPFQETPFYLFAFYLLTETGTMPQVLITCFIFAAIPLLYLKLPYKQTVICFLIIVAYLGVGQIVKASMKNTFQEARPYVTWLEAENLIPPNTFYQLSRSERTQLIHDQDFSEYNIPQWQQEHWEKETGFSFPSGHTIFAAQWFFLYLLLLWRTGAYLPIVLMGFWSAGILISRLFLGMHWPIDLLVSTLLAAIIIYPAFLCIKKWGMPKQVTPDLGHT